MNSNNMNKSELSNRIKGHVQKAWFSIDQIKTDKSLLTFLEVVCNPSYLNIGKLLIAGNGGRTEDAQHFAGELVSRFNFDRPPLSVIALTTDSSILIAIGNDYGYENVFARQIQAHARTGDVFIAVSTSGNSPNILKALEAVKSIGLVVIRLTGRSGGKMKDMCDVCLCAPSESKPRIQECHLFFEHTLSACIEESRFGELRK